METQKRWQYHNMVERERAIPDLIDKLLPYFPLATTFSLEDAINKSEIPHHERFEIERHYNFIIDSLVVHFKYATDIGDNLCLTDEGRSARAAGGHFAYQKLKQEKEKLEKERQELNDEKLRYDVKNARRIFSTYWWTFWISVTGLLLTVGKILFDVFKH